MHPPSPVSVASNNDDTMMATAMPPLNIPLMDRKPAAKIPIVSASSLQQQPASGTKQKKRVTISGKVKIREIPHLNDMEQEVIDAVFLAPEDYAEFKKSYTVIVRRMMKLKDEFVSDDGDNCSRGLEFRTKEGARKRKRTKKAAIEAVLDEQDIQREDGMVDDHFIADVYRAVTSPCRMAALSRGLKDEKWVMESLDPEEREERLRQREIAKNKKFVMKTPNKQSSVDCISGEDLPRRLVVLPK